MSIFHPKEHVKSIYQIDFLRLKESGIRGIIFDLDDTLIPRTSDHITPQLLDWVNHIQEMGFKVCISSNGVRPHRVEIIGQQLGIPVITLAFKPFPFAFHTALKILDAPPHRIAVIGDFVFTDILGGNFYGMHTILVDPLSRVEPFLPRRMMRWMEDLFVRRS